MTDQIAAQKSVNTLLSGPAGGVLAAEFLAKITDYHNIITGDLGGTSFDVGIVQNGSIGITGEGVIEGFPVKFPHIDITTIGAGGGSIAWLDAGGALRVGPRSAGAVPGPVCYSKGGTEPTVTDAHAVLGRVGEKLLGGKMHLDVAAARKAIEEKLAVKLNMTVEEVAEGILRVANSNMVRAIRVMTVERGIDPRKFVLLPYGGAGALHAVELARTLDIGTVVIPIAPGNFSAFGLLVAPIRYDKAYLAALIAASSPFGFMIPPNVNAIIFASVSSASVGALFMATIVPGLIWAGLYLIINRIIYIKYYHPEYAGKTVASVSACTEDNEPKEESEKNARETISRNRFFLELVVAVLMPIIVLGGIYGGIFTATEAGAITCLYGAIMGVVVYKKLSLVQLMGVFSKGVKDVSALVIMFPMTLIFSRLMTLNHIPELVAELMLGITNNRIGLILLIDLLLFFIGFFLDGNVIILTLVPLLTPIATACGIDTIQLAVIVFVSIGIGSITPPMATCLMACSRVCDVPIHKLIKPILPFLLFGALPILLLVSFVPVVSTWLPGLFYSF